MKGEADDKKKGQENKTFYFKVCPGCRAKLHIDAKKCLKCGADYWQKCQSGEWQEICCISHNPEDAVYSKPMNNVEKCMRCTNVTQRGIICKPKYCFSSGRGKCDNCKTFDPTIFDCCQDEQKEKGVVTREHIQILREALKSLGKRKNTEPVAMPAAITEDHFDDDIPF